jgi:small-conductance mechanosensitive channel
MTPAIPELVGAIAPLGIAIALLVLGMLSRRLGKATRARPLYFGFFAAAVLLFITALLHIANAFIGFAPLTDPVTDPFWVLVFNGLPAIGVTIGLVLVWRYWSWLLAERS